LFDGFKESHRKIIYSAFKRGLDYKGESLKVAQFAGYVAEHSNYHHGEQILYDTIIKMAQRFVGSNNVPLFFNDGQYGSKLELGKDAANGRYIFTKLDQLTRLIFRKDDEPYLADIIDDGDTVEKEYYMPIVPMILINGLTAGIGSGWSSQVPAHNLEDVVDWIKSWLASEKPDSIVPWYRGFKGEIEVDGGKIYTKGVLEEGKTNSGYGYRIREIPIGKKGLSIRKYKEQLIEMLDEGKIKTLKDNGDEEKIEFIITSQNKLDLESLGLVDVLTSTNMVLFDGDNRIRHFNTSDEILEEYCQGRLNKYIERKAGVTAKLESTIKILQSKIKFIKDVLDGNIVLRGKDEDQLSSELKEKKFIEVEDSYDYLLTIQVKSMTSKRIESLEKEIQGLESELEMYLKSTPADLWKKELDELLSAWKASPFYN
jgi:DNA topoisomerase-2